VHRTLFRTDLVSVRTVDVDGYVAGAPNALDPSATRAYFAVDGAVVEMDLTTGVERRRIAVPDTVRRLYVLPTGDRLVIASDGAVRIVGVE
jgi:hypothetical protein